MKKTCINCVYGKLKKEDKEKGKAFFCDIIADYVWVSSHDLEFCKWWQKNAKKDL